MKNCYWLSLSLFVISLTVSAQKLPNVQTISLRAPADIKIDGKTNEWNNQFQAYNHATDIFYTIANDSNNLYLVIQVKDFISLAKITCSGIVFNIFNSNEKNDNDAISITYPYFEVGKKPFISYRNLPKIVSGSAVSVQEADSVMRSFNRRLEEKSHYIKVTGIKELDTLISIYNEDGIKAKEAFDNTFTYTSELAIPLKYLNLPSHGPSKFTYHIISPKISTKDLGIKMTVVNGVNYITSDPGAAASLPARAQIMYTVTTTDFWGEYTLAKK